MNTVQLAELEREATKAWFVSAIGEDRFLCFRSGEGVVRERIDRDLVFKERDKRRAEYVAELVARGRARGCGF